MSYAFILSPFRKLPLHCNQNLGSSFFQWRGVSSSQILITIGYFCVWPVIRGLPSLVFCVFEIVPFGMAAISGYSSCRKYKLLEISRLPSRADLDTIELSETFHQVGHFLHNTTKIVLM